MCFGLKSFHNITAHQEKILSHSWYYELHLWSTLLSLNISKSVKLNFSCPSGLFLKKCHSTPGCVRSWFSAALHEAYSLRTSSADIITTHLKDLIWSFQQPILNIELIIMQDINPDWAVTEKPKTSREWHLSEKSSKKCSSDYEVDQIYISVPSGVFWWLLHTKILETSLIGKVCEIEIETTTSKDTFVMTFYDSCTHVWCTWILCCVMAWPKSV